jgi:hypothetical protein
MKNQLLAVAAAMIFVAAAPAPSHAQQVRASVPFDFQAGDTVMPAGEYQLERGLSGTKRLQRIERTDSSISAFVATDPVDTAQKNVEPRLIFHCYADECFLSEIWAGPSQGRKLEVSRREKQLARANAENELAYVSLPLRDEP